MTKVLLDLQKCIGCGTCASVCSDLFELGDDTKAHIKGASINSLIEEKVGELPICVDEAAEACPITAIEIQK
jgi:ferredoxin